MEVLTLKQRQMIKPNLQFRVQNLRNREIFTQIVCNEMYLEAYKHFDEHPRYRVIEVKDIEKHKLSERVKYFQVRIQQAKQHIKDIKYIIKRYGSNPNNQLILKHNTSQVEYYNELLNREIL